MNASDGAVDRFRQGCAFGEQFRARHGSVECRELMGCDISTPEGHQRAVEQHLFATRCPALVRDAVELLAELVPA